MRNLSRKLGAPFARSAKVFWRLAGPDGTLLCPEDILDKAKWKDITVVVFVARKPVPWKDMIVLGWKGHKIIIPVAQVHVQATWSPEYDEMLETVKGMREKIASQVRRPARGFDSGSA
jgi:hypothetical protein